MKTVEMIETISYVQGILSVLDPDDKYCGQVGLEQVISGLKNKRCQECFGASFNDCGECDGFIQG